MSALPGKLSVYDIDKARNLCYIIGRLRVAVNYIIKDVKDSNKAANTIIARRDVAYTHRISAKHKVYITKPKIDKISIVYDIPDIDVRKIILGGLMETFDLGEDEVVQRAKGGSQQKYKMAAQICPPNTEHKMLVQLAPKAKATKFLRLEFNPDLLGCANVKWALSYLSDEILYPPYNWSDLIHNGLVTRVDVACDLVNIWVGDPLVKQHNNHKSHVFHGLNGWPETIYINPLTANGNLRKYGDMVYDKARQLKDTAKQLKDKAKRLRNKANQLKGINQQLEDKAEQLEAQAKQLENESPDLVYHESIPHTRVEVKYKGVKKSPLELATIKDKFHFFEILAFGPDKAPDKTGGKSYIWKLFLDSCRYRGEGSAIELLPKELQDRYMDVLNLEEKAPLWRPHKIWKHWPEVVADSGLFDIGNHHQV